MRIVKSIFTMLLIGTIGITLITTRPSRSDFAKWYVEQNQTGLGDLIDAAFVKVIEQRTKVSEYLIFSVFNIGEDERYVGILGHFFGKNTVDQVQQTLNEILKQAEDTINNKSGSRIDKSENSTGRFKRAFTG